MRVYVSLGKDNILGTYLTLDLHKPFNPVGLDWPPVSICISMLNAHLLQLHSLLAGLFLLCRSCVGIKSLMGYLGQGPGMIKLMKLRSDVLLLMSLEVNHLDGVDLVCSSHVLLLMLLQPMILMNHPAIKLD